jgi:hypothetical protein
MAKLNHLAGAWSPGQILADAGTSLFISAVSAEEQGVIVSVVDAGKCWKKIKSQTTTPLTANPMLSQREPLTLSMPFEPRRLMWSKQSWSVDQVSMRGCNSSI